MQNNGLYINWRGGRKTNKLEIWDFEKGLEQWILQLQQCGNKKLRNTREIQLMCFHK